MQIKNRRERFELFPAGVLPTMAPWRRARPIINRWRTRTIICPTYHRLRSCNVNVYVRTKHVGNTTEQDPKKFHYRIRTLVDCHILDNSSTTFLLWRNVWHNRIVAFFTPRPLVCWIEVNPLSGRSSLNCHHTLTDIIEPVGSVVGCTPCCEVCQCYRCRPHRLPFQNFGGIKPVW